MNQKKTLLLGGHRGLGCTDSDFFSFREINKLPTENTFESIEAAFKSGADFIETDAVMSCDGEIFLLHNVNPSDHFFAKIRPSKTLNKLNFESFKNFPIGKSKQGQILTLKELLKALPNLDPKTAPFGLNLEIKGVQGTDQDFESNSFLEKIAETIKDSDYPANRILLSSFCLENILRLSKLIPEANFGMLFAEGDTPMPIYKNKRDLFNFSYLPGNIHSASEVSRLWGDNQAIYFIPEVRNITPEFINFSAQHSAGIISWGWQEKIDKERIQHYQQIINLCANSNIPYFIITDYIEFMLKNIKG